jgi:hypothetical protein
MRPNNRAREHARAGPTTLVAVAAASLAALAVALLVPTGGAAQSQVAPRNTGEPSISGNPVVGETVQATRGTWTGTEPISFAFQWVRCPRSGGRADGSDCAVISGATTTAYVIGNADVDRRLRVRVTGSNSEGSATAASNATALVTRPASGQPRNTQRPAIAGTLRANETLRANPGTWTGTQPISFSFQWLRCDPGGGNCLTLAGFNDDGYTLRDGDIGRSLRVQVTARNSEGSSSRLSPRSRPSRGRSGWRHQAAERRDVDPRNERRVQRPARHRPRRVLAQPGPLKEHDAGRSDQGEGDARERRPRRARLPALDAPRHDDAGGRQDGSGRLDRIPGPT